MNRLHRLVSALAAAGCFGWFFASTAAAQGVPLQFDHPPNWTVLAQDQASMQFGSPSGDRLLVGNLSGVSCSDALRVAQQLAGGKLVELDIQSFPDGAVTYASVAGGRSWRTSIATYCRAGLVALVMADHAGARGETATLTAAMGVLNSLRIAPPQRAAAAPAAPPLAPGGPAVSTSEFDKGFRSYDSFRSTMQIWYGR